MEEAGTQGKQARWGPDVGEWAAQNNGINLTRVSCTSSGIHGQTHKYGPQLHQQLRQRQVFQFPRRQCRPTVISTQTTQAVLDGVELNSWQLLALPAREHPLIDDLIDGLHVLHGSHQTDQSVVAFRSGSAAL